VPLTQPPELEPVEGDVIDAAIDAAGEQVAFALVQKLGGSRVYVPKRPRESSGGNALLVEAVGLDGAEALAKIWGGEIVLVPLGLNRNFLQKRARIAELLGQGKSVQAIARQLHVHERTVQRVAERIRHSDGRQGSLF